MRRNETELERIGGGDGVEGRWTVWVCGWMETLYEGDDCVIEREGRSPGSPLTLPALQKKLMHGAMFADRFASLLYSKCLLITTIKNHRPCHQCCIQNHSTPDRLRCAPQLRSVHSKEKVANTTERRHANTDPPYPTCVHLSPLSGDSERLSWQRLLPRQSRCQNVFLSVLEVPPHFRAWRRSGGARSSIWSRGGWIECLHRQHLWRRVGEVHRRHRRTVKLVKVEAADVVICINRCFVVLQKWQCQTFDIAPKKTERRREVRGNEPGRALVAHNEERSSFVRSTGWT